MVVGYTLKRTGDVVNGPVVSLVGTDEEGCRESVGEAVGQGSPRTPSDVERNRDVCVLSSTGVFPDRFRRSEARGTDDRIDALDSPLNGALECFPLFESLYIDGLVRLESQLEVTASFLAEQIWALAKPFAVCSCELGIDNGFLQLDTLKRLDVDEIGAEFLKMG